MDLDKEVIRSMSFRELVNGSIRDTVLLKAFSLFRLFYFYHRCLFYSELSVGSNEIPVENLSVVFFCF